MNAHGQPTYKRQRYLLAFVSQLPGDGIRSTYLQKLVFLNMMETKFLQNIDEKIVQMTAESSALKRNINVEETVNGITFLLSDEASYVNGTNLNLSGGDYMI